ncbi:hypothetical protein NE237_017509 [Protea cynaroides]|uniref:Uncharacterized protein n=1 Tax=Protea cynaroides TaxID=273540 RepID=A0A9Q0K878_9MAGN|nr:hypothetical protein NE237_017509 [Protea cynaroides]
MEDTKSASVTDISDGFVGSLYPSISSSLISYVATTEPHYHWLLKSMVDLLFNIEPEPLELGEVAIDVPYAADTSVFESSSTVGHPALHLRRHLCPNETNRRNGERKPRGKTALTVSLWG